MREKRIGREARRKKERAEEEVRGKTSGFGSWVCVYVRERVMKNILLKGNNVS